MALNSLEKSFVDRWKRLDFSNWNEPDIREQFITPLLIILGYSKGTVHDINREKHLRLTEPYHRIGRKKVSIDYVPTIRLRNFWIIEAKPGQAKELKFGDLLQAHLYTIHPEVQARFIVLTNGWEVRIYDALTVRDWNDVVHVSTQTDCEETFEDLVNILGARNMMRFIRQRTLQALSDSFATEIDENVIHDFQREIHQVAQRSLQIVRSNARELRFSGWREAEAEELDRLKEITLDELLVSMDIPTNPSLAPANEYVRRILAADQDTKTFLVDKLAMNYRGRPHSIFRVSCTFVLVELIRHGVHVQRSQYVLSIQECLEELVECNASYWEGNDIANALCHLDNSSLRIAKKLGLRMALPQMSELVNAQKATLSAEDLLKNPPSVAQHMIVLIGWYAEMLWRLFCSSQSPEEIWQGIWFLDIVESTVEQIPEQTYPTGDADLLFFELYGRSADMLRLGTWDILHRNKSVLVEETVPSTVLDFANLTREEVVVGIPLPSQKPVGWKPDKNMMATLNRLLGKTSHSI